MTDPFPSVSTDQVAAFAAVARAGTLRDAAAELHLTEQTVRNYASSLYSKLQVRSRAEAMVWAAAHTEA